MKHCEEWEGMSIGVFDDGLLLVEYLWSDEDVTDEHYSLVEQHLWEQGIEWSD